MPNRFEIAYSKEDEYYTPKYAIYPLLKYLPKSKFKKRVWCPFDNSKSNFVKVLKGANYNVINTHLDFGEDFFDLAYDVDMIISNPPYSKKTEVFKRLYKLGIPFAMLVGFTGLFESQERFDMFRRNKFEILHFNTRVKFFTDWENQTSFTSPPFQTVYVCSNILPNQFCFEMLEQTKSTQWIK